jgi:hypothetical protein
MGTGTGFSFEEDKIEKEKLVVLARQSMGNGKIEDLKDIIYVKKEAFDKLRTKEIAAELEILNKKLILNNSGYILLGPGRWGTADPFIGIPVNWSNISNARIIIETSMEDFPLDASLGSHFFHNVTSMNVGYFSIQYDSKESLIAWDILEEQEVIEETEFLKHIVFKEKLCVLMDGKKRMSAILKESCYSGENLIDD